ncbi:MAG: J domain-containing protein [Marinobacter sp.]
MTCWNILGIEPTADLERIRQAYESQMKFASDDEARALEQAFQEAIDDDRELDAGQAQIAREVVIQIKALMNSDHRQQDVGIWKAILCEPPADQPALRREIGRQLEARIRPMAENGAFPAAVAQFLGDWFDWSSVRSANQVAELGNPDAGNVDTLNADFGNVDSRNPDSHNYPESDKAPDQDSPEQPPMTNFWPAVIGWIAGLIILATIFGGMGG